MRRRAFITITVFVLALTVLISIRFSFRPESLGTNIRIVLGQNGSHAIITNVGTRTVQLSVVYQTFANGKWHPPEEDLFRYPFGILKPKERFTMAYTNIPSTNVSRRVVVLCQYYPETFGGKFLHFIHSRLIHPDRFSRKDHRGPQDEFLYSEVFDRPSSSSEDR